MKLNWDLSGVISDIVGMKLKEMLMEKSLLSELR